MSTFNVPGEVARMSYSLSSEEEVVALVRGVANEVYDPCGLAQGVSIGIVDLGLIRGLNVERLEGGWEVSLRIRLTSPGCFYFFYFQREIRDRLKAVPQIRSLNIEWDEVLDWTPEKMSEWAHLKLKAHREKVLAANIARTGRKR